MGTPITGALNATGVTRTRDSEPISGFIACCQHCHRPGVINTVPSDSQFSSVRYTLKTNVLRGKLWHVSLIVSGGACSASLRQQSYLFSGSWHDVPRKRDWIDSCPHPDSRLVVTLSFLADVHGFFNPSSRLVNRSGSVGHYRLSPTVLSRPFVITTLSVFRTQ